MKTLKFCLLTLLALVGCSKVDEQSSPSVNRDYLLFEDRLIEWENIFLQEEDDYIVYFFRETCGHCQAIKEDVIDYYLMDIDVMYFIKNPEDEIYFSSRLIDIRGVNDASKLKIYGVPAILEIVNHQVLNYHYGEKEILAFLTV